MKVAIIKKLRTIYSFLCIVSSIFCAFIAHFVFFLLILFDNVEFFLNNFLRPDRQLRLCEKTTKFHD